MWVCSVLLWSWRSRSIDHSSSPLDQSSSTTRQRPASFPLFPARTEREPEGARCGCVLCCCGVGGVGVSITRLLHSINPRPPPVSVPRPSLSSRLEPRGNLKEHDVGVFCVAVELEE